MKRIIFVLLYNSGFFVQSRNFRNQKVGDIEWLFNNYNFKLISQGIDEIVLLDISPDNINSDNFLEIINKISSECFIPVTAGGKINSISDADLYIKNGAEKLLINSLFFENLNECKKISQKYGKQCIVASIDITKSLSSNSNKFNLYFNKSKNLSKMKINEWIELVDKNGAGEILIQSIYRDGTGKGLDLEIFDKLSSKVKLPTIALGGVGNELHISDALKSNNIDAVATANLLNFVGATFNSFRHNLIKKNINLVKWDQNIFEEVKNFFND